MRAASTDPVSAPHGGAPALPWRDGALSSLLFDPEAFRAAFEEPSLVWAIDVDAPPHPEYWRVNEWADRSLTNSYQWDLLCARARREFARVFSGDPDASDVLVVFAPSGTAANRLTTTAVLNQGSGLVVNDTAHCVEREGGSVPAQTGSTLYVVPTNGARLTADGVDLFIRERKRKFWITQQPLVLSITNPAEDGTMYRPEEVHALAEVAHSHGMLLQMDGARLFHAAASSGISLKQFTTDLGVDMLALGGSKVGMYKAEAAVFLPGFFAQCGKTHLYKDAISGWNQMRSHLKRHGNLMAQSAGVAAQFLRAFEQDFGLELSRRTVAQAQKLAAAIKEIPGYTLFRPVDTNVVLVAMSSTRHELLGAKFGELMVWKELPNDEVVVRFISNYSTTDDQIDSTVKFLRSVSV